MEPRLKVLYRDSAAAGLMEEFSYKNPMQIPRLNKIVVNTSIKEAITNVKVLDAAAAEIALITGQKPIIRKARRSIGQSPLISG